MFWRPKICLAPFFWLVLASPAIGQSLSLVDDRGEAIEEVLQVCFVQGLETECRDHAGDEGARISLQPFEVVRIEGPRHGPVVARPGDLARGPGGGAYLAVPRKTRVRITGLPGGPVTMSLYPVDEPDARLPTHRLELTGTVMAEALYIPAGEHLASLGVSGAAPDLHALAADPGGDVSIRYRRNDGWSLAVRVMSPDGIAPVGGATVSLAAPAPDERDGTKPLGIRTTDELGFALFQGLSVPMVHAKVSHPAHVDTPILGLAAPPGAFDRSEVALEVGGSIEAEVLVAGRPASHVECSVVEHRGRDERRNVIVVAVQEGSDGPDGICRIDRVPAGERHVRIDLTAEVGEVGAESTSAVDRVAHVVEGELTRLQVDLSPIELSGTVYLGQEPVGAGHRVLVGDLRSQGPAGTEEPALAAVTDEAGRYSGVLWEPGEYYLMVLRPAGGSDRPIREYLSAASEEIDLHLPERQIEGRVVDGEGDPVPGARVSLVWDGRHVVGGFAGDRGEFAFPVRTEEGTVVVSARRTVGPAGAEVELSIVPDTPIPPVTLTLREPGRVDGRLVSASGAPIAAGRVWSYRMAETGVPILVGADSTRADGTFHLPPSPDGVTWIYASGPGCPLEVHVATGEAEPNGPDDRELRCPSVAAALRVRMLDAEGDGMTGQSLILRHQGQVIPPDVVEAHLVSLGLPTESDARGRLVLAGLAPGGYELYLQASSNPYTVAQGMRHGFVAASTLTPSAPVDLEIVVDSSR